LHEHGFQSELIEIALSHTSGNQTRDAYDRSQQVERRRQMMHWWSGYIVASKAGSLPLQSSVGRSGTIV